jgi:hypothetical protein
MRGVRQSSSWTWFWVARRKESGDWSEASTVREAVRKATLLPARKPPAWLRDAAAEAEKQIISDPNAVARVRRRNLHCDHALLARSAGPDTVAAASLGLGLP